jgi:uroporphyrinogen decarboxylase
MQIAAGVDAVQIFDSHGGHLAAGEFQEASGRWMREIIAHFNPGRAGSPLPADGAHGVTRPTSVPTIVFSLGTHGNWPDLIATGANVIGIDWQTSLAEARQLIPAHIGIQGNLPPALLSDATPELVAVETRKVLEAMRGRAGHIFNLGHGLTPGAKLENIQALVDTVKNFS